MASGESGTAGGMGEPAGHVTGTDGQKVPTHPNPGMPTPGEQAPDFTAPFVGDEVVADSLSDRLGDGPVVLAFFPAAFTGTCRTEMCTFRDRLANFAEVDATVLGVSTDLPYALSEFRDRNDLPFDLVSDNDAEIVDAYDVADEWDDVALDVVAKRAVVVIDGDGTVTYRWVADDPGREPDYDEVEAAVNDVA